MQNVKSITARVFDESDAAIIANGAAMSAWMMKQNYCRSCGSPMKIVKGGQKAVCVECKQAVYPELMACCLSLITCGNYVLLGRNAKWPQNFYSLLAGFVEASESLEASVVRETLEEASIELTPSSVEYVMSQPWPFPNQLMIGFRAAVEPVRLGPLKMPPNPKMLDSELADARWFHVDYLAPRLSPERAYADPREVSVDIPFGEIALPGEHALARRLIQMWVDEKMSYRRRRCDDRLITTLVSGSFFTECELSNGEENVDASSSFVEDGSGDFHPLHFVMCEVLLAQEGQAPVVIRAAPGEISTIRNEVIAEVERVGQGARAVAYVRATGKINCKRTQQGTQQIQIKMLSEASDDGFDARAITVAMLQKACPFHEFYFV
jgi:NADH pyrophosphatase NudC (nudix superfamily)